MNIQRLQKPHKQKFMNEEEIQQALRLMEQDASLNTTSKLTIRIGMLPPARLGAFRERHAEYLREHPKVNPEHYLSNLRTVIRIRS
ncbi:MAG: hypothetical protein WA843_03460 [Candidatus Saccharimonadales bacterium]